MTIALRGKNRKVWVGQWSYQRKDSLPLGISVEANHLWINIGNIDNIKGIEE